MEFPPFDLYQELEVTTTASTEDIETAYKRLARACHPDLHPNDPAAEERFKRVSRAKAILCDNSERVLYDSYRRTTLRSTTHTTAGTATGYTAPPRTGDPMVDNLISDLFRRTGGPAAGRPGYERVRVVIDGQEVHIDGAFAGGPLNIDDIMRQTERLIADAQRQAAADRRSAAENVRRRQAATYRDLDNEIRRLRDEADASMRDWLDDNAPSTQPEAADIFQPAWFTKEDLRTFLRSLVILAVLLLLYMYFLVWH